MGIPRGGPSIYAARNYNVNPAAFGSEALPPPRLNAGMPVGNALKGYTIPSMPSEVTSNAQLNSTLDGIYRPNFDLSQSAGPPKYAQPNMFDRGVTAFKNAPAAIGPDTITNPAYTEKGFFDKLSYLKDQGFNKSVNNAITGNPIATTAAGLGLLGGGTGSLSNPAPQPAIPDFTTAGKTYAKRPYQKQGVARSFVDAPDGYRPGFDPERSYLSPISTYNQGFATGGLAALMPKVPKITPAMSFGGGDVTSNPSNPSDVNDVTNDTDFGQPDSTPAPPESSLSIGEAVASGVLGALTGGVFTGAVSAFTNAGMQAMGAPTVMGVAADAFTGGQTSTGTGGMSGADISDVNDAANDTGFGPPDGAPGSNSGGAGSSGGQGDPDGPGGAVGDRPRRDRQR